MEANLLLKDNPPQIHKMQAKTLESQVMNWDECWGQKNSKRASLIFQKQKRTQTESKTRIGHKQKGQTRTKASYNRNSRNTLDNCTRVRT